MILAPVVAHVVELSVNFLFALRKRIFWAIAGPWCLFIFLGEARAQAAWEVPHAASVAKFRAGQVREAAAELAQLVTRFPDVVLLRRDAIVVVAANGAPDQAVAFASPLDLSQTPAYVLFPLARAARDTRNFALAQRAYETLATQSAQMTDVERANAQIGLALSLFEQGRANEASAALAVIAPVQNVAIQISIAEARALIAESQGRDADVLRYTDEVLALDPTHRSALRMRRGATLRLGVPQVIAQDDASLSDEERARFLQESTALSTRYLFPDERASDTGFRLDIALDQLADVIARFPATEGARRARMDRVVFLNERGEREKALQELRTLNANTSIQDFPAWFRGAGGQTLLSNRLAAESVGWFESAIAGGADDMPNQASLMYALLESERPNDAVEHARKYSERIGNPLREASRERAERAVDARLLYVRALLYTDQARAAWQLIDELKRAAPANREISLLWAEVARTRGWPRMAGEEFDSLSAEFPDRTDALVNRADTTRAIGDRVLAWHLLQQAQQIDPESRAGLRALKGVAAADAPVLRLSMARALSANAAGALANPSRELRIESSLTSPLFAGAYTVSAGGFMLRDTLPNGASRLRQGASVSMQRETAGLVLAASAFASDGGDRNVQGAAAQARLAVGDSLSLSAEMGYDDLSLPLRALPSATHLTHARLGARYAWDESRIVGASIGFADFTDGNRRTDISVHWADRLFAHAHLKIDHRLDTYWVKNEKTDVPYFAPAQRYGASLSLAAHWLTWRHYERSVEQSLTAIVGRDWQQNVDATDVLGGRYEAALRLGECFAMRGGAEVLRRGYDGKPETRKAVFLNAELRWF